MCHLFCYFIIANNRSCHQLGKHSNIHCQIHKILLGRHFLPIHFYHIADHLEGIEANTNGQGNTQKSYRKSGQCAKILQKKITILTYPQGTKTQYQRGDQTCFRMPPLFDQNTKKKSLHDHQYQYRDETRFSPPIEKQTCQKQDRISKTGRYRKIYN